MNGTSSFEKELIEKVTETNTMIKDLIRRIESIEERVTNAEGRINEIDTEYQVLMGKITIVVMIIGAVVTYLFNTIFGIWKRFSG